MLKKRRSSIRKLSAVLLSLAMFLSLFLVTTPVWAAPADGVYSFGNNGNGQLGIGSRWDHSYSPVRIEGLGSVKAVAVGDNHSLVLLHNGDVYSFGSNRYGQLGHGDTEHRLTPTKIQGIGKVKAIGAGREHSLIVLENGDVYSFGAGGYWKLGHGDRENRSVPTKIQGLSNAVAVTGGQDHTLILLGNGDVYGVGSHNSGQLGLGSGVGLTHETPKKIPLTGSAKAIAACSIHSLVLMANGDVYAFGSNRNGGLGSAPSNPINTPVKVAGLGPAKAVSAGSGFSLVLLENGDLYSFGDNSYAQLGLGDKADRGTPTKVALSGVSLISSGYRHSLAVLENGDVYSFGQGSGGKLGHGDQGEKTTPARIASLSGNKGLSIAAGFSFSLVQVGTPPIAVRIDGKLLETDVPPISLNNRTMVPLRAIFEALGMDVKFIPETGTIIGTRGQTTIQLVINSTQSTVNGETVVLDVPATVIDNRTLVPVRFIAESTGQGVGWDAPTRTVNITTIEPGDTFKPGEDLGSLLR